MSDANSVGPSWGPRFCISYHIPSDADVAKGVTSESTDKGKIKSISQPLRILKVSYVIGKCNERKI